MIDQPDQSEFSDSSHEMLPAETDNEMAPAAAGIDAPPVAETASAVGRLPVIPIAVAVIAVTVAVRRGRKSQIAVSRSAVDFAVDFGKIKFWIFIWNFYHKIFQFVSNVTCVVEGGLKFSGGWLAFYVCFAFTNLTLSVSAFLTE